ncbi:hypothetical protein IMG5_204470 [Ichthyophthirius multifiliis]|uniref:Elongator complex protein 2 n=1 Tax=Ichthyophthirius multifiliis TaxID=5932 RepID=G0R6H7_ICHMU|nr:hypothetical protein IMG5_204470 [Ichthyophthirius multifiliis]EGR26935.1 hypothetical protein IMG5_204470 [Ichthyophthirius multifiliis]|eukprot:XP_004023819.1 hypothetical protein IMG5_204470 [Ichthyophthirius multifiliis]
MRKQHNCIRFRKYKKFIFFKPPQRKGKFCTNYQQLQRQRTSLIWKCRYQINIMAMCRRFFKNHEKWEIIHEFDLENSVQFCSICEYKENEVYVLAGNIMGDVFLIKITDDKKQILDRIKFGSHFTQETSRMIKLDDKNQILIFFGGLDFSVHVYLFDLQTKYNKKGDFFNYKISLRGHENAITDIKILYEKENNQWIIASSSKDSYIRLWKFSKGGQEAKLSEFQNKEIQKFDLNNEEYFISLESVISGHNESVVSLDWGFYNEQVVLLSALLILVSLFGYLDQYVKIRLNYWKQICFFQCQIFK